MFYHIEIKTSRDIIFNPVATTTTTNGTYIENPNPVFTWSSGFINLLRYNNLYIHSGNLGVRNSIGPRGESTIIRKIPVTAGYGGVTFYQQSPAHDYAECSRQLLRRLEFQLKDVNGEFIDLHGLIYHFLLFSRII